MPFAAAEDVVSRLEECLLDLDELGFTLAGAHLSHAIETIRTDCARMPTRRVVMEDEIDDQPAPLDLLEARSQGRS